MMAIRSVAVIGVGSMGGRMARRIHGAGFELMVCDRNPDALAAFAEIGVRTTGDASACAGADLIIVLVATPAQLRDVALGRDGIEAALKPGVTPILAVMSTVTPATIREVEAVLGPLGVRVIDAPVSGGLVKAADGTLTIMVGGEAAVFEAARQVLETMGTNLFHCGGHGAGQASKIVNNMLGIANLTMTAEAYRLAVEQGLTLAEVTRIMELSTGRNFFSREPGDAPKAYAAWANTPPEFASIMAIIRKDIALALELAEASTGSFPVTKGLYDTIGTLGDETLATWQTIGALAVDAMKVVHPGGD